MKNANVDPKIAALLSKMDPKTIASLAGALAAMGTVKEVKDNKIPASQISVKAGKDVVHFEVTLDKKPADSKEGKSITVASSRGFGKVNIGKNEATYSLSAYVPKNGKVQKDPTVNAELKGNVLSFDLPLLKSAQTSKGGPMYATTKGTMVTTATYKNKNIELNINVFGKKS